jgi:hypothetical protein
MLQAMKEEPPLNAKCKDKFLIQSTLITREKEALPLQDIWATPEGGDDTTKVYQQKLRVTYLPPEGQPLLPEEVEPQVPAVPEPVNGHELHPTSSTEQENGVPEEAIQQPSKQEPPRSNTPHNEYKFAPEESHEHEEHARDVPIEDLSHLHISSASNPLDDHVPEHHELAPEPEPAPLPIPPVSSRRPSGQSVPVSLQPEDIESHPLYQELLAEYNAALAELQKLRRELDESSRYEGTKSRPYANSVASDIDDNVYQQDGVPLQIVVIIALAVFITTYLFL